MHQLNKGRYRSIVTTIKSRQRLFSTAPTALLPLEIVDPHHHFFAPTQDPALHATLARIGVTADHLPADHAKDFDVGASRVVVSASVHVEALPDDGLGEVAFVERLLAGGGAREAGGGGLASHGSGGSKGESVVVSSPPPPLLSPPPPTCTTVVPLSGVVVPPVRGLVVSCDLSRPDVEEELERLANSSPRVKGVRWICNYAGDLKDGETAIVSRATWPRVDKDFSSDECFARGLRALQKQASAGAGRGRSFSFDLQANPRQLCAWADRLATLPNVPVCVDHLGHPRNLLPLPVSGGDAVEVDDSVEVDDAVEVGDAVEVDAAELFEWRKGMRRLAKLPQVCVKLSMLSYAVPGWWRWQQQQQQGKGLANGHGGIATKSKATATARSALKRRHDLAKALVLETVNLFGAHRCMFASNWPVDGEDGLTVGIMYGHYRSWVAHLPPHQQASLFRDTASNFYRLSA
mmetsp:Transcript_71093/g.143087  ORF Transcript_71093/g.143087 Transcript_71093/m.143087 type:complete len:463 (+) Transcript_71093:62-1450(+)